MDENAMNEKKCNGIARQSVRSSVQGHSAQGHSVQGQFPRAHLRDS